MATSLLLSYPLLQSPQFPEQVSKKRTPCSIKPILLNNPSKTAFLNRHLFSYPLIKPRNRPFMIPLAVGNKTDETEFLVGEDSADFDLAKQKISSWIYFTGILGIVLFVLNVAWIDNSTGFGKDFITAVSSISDSHEVFTLIQIFCKK